MCVCMMTYIKLHVFKIERIFTVSNLKVIKNIFSLGRLTRLGYAENLLVDDNAYVHHYKMRDEQGQTLTPHGGIWLLELKKFNANQVETEDQRWLKFFKDGERLNDEALPDWMITQEMKQAMRPNDKSTY